MNHALSLFKAELRQTMAQLGCARLGDLPRFLAEWKVDPNSTKPTVIVMNPKGLTLGRLTGVPTAAKIIETSKKKPCSNPSRSMRSVPDAAGGPKKTGASAPTARPNSRKHATTAAT